MYYTINLIISELLKLIYHIKKLQINKKKISKFLMLILLKWILDSIFEFFIVTYPIFAQLIFNYGVYFSLDKIG